MKKIYEVEFKAKLPAISNTTFFVHAKSMIEAIKIGEKLSKTIINFDDKPLKTFCIRCSYYAELDN